MPIAHFMGIPAVRFSGRIPYFQRACGINLALVLNLRLHDREVIGSNIGKLVM
jgi:hypothetical protein